MAYTVLKNDRKRSWGRFRFARPARHRPLALQAVPARSLPRVLGRQAWTGAGLASAGRRLVVVHAQMLAVEHRRLARPLVCQHGGADFRRRGSIGERPGHQPQLHAEPGTALLDHDDRPQRRQRRIRSRFQKPRHSARKPPTEFAPPTSTPNSVRWTASWTPPAAAASASCGVVR